MVELHADLAFLNVREAAQLFSVLIGEHTQRAELLRAVGNDRLGGTRNRCGNDSCELLAVECGIILNVYRDPSFAAVLDMDGQAELWQRIGNDVFNYRFVFQNGCLVDAELAGVVYF